MLQNDELNIFNTAGLIPNSENNLNFSQPLLRSDDELAIFEANFNLLAPESDPTEAPVLQGAELKFKDDNGAPFADNEPVLFLTADNALIDEDDLLTSTGSRLEDLQAQFYLGSQVYEGTILPALSQQVDDNRVEVAVKVPTAVPLGSSRITLSREQDILVEQNGTNSVYEVIELESNQIRLDNDTEYVFTALAGADRVSVVDASDPETTVNNTESSDLEIAKISVGGSGSDRPESLAITSDNGRVYVPLKNSGGVAVVDPMTLSQVDNLPDTPEEVDPIPLPDGAKPLDIAIGLRDEYAYIADESQPNVYVLDIDPFSSTYHQVVETIELDTTGGLNRLEISSDYWRLFVTAKDGYIYAVNVDAKDKPQPEEVNSNKWHEQIGRIETEQGAMGISASHEAEMMTFTSGNRNFDFNGFGVLEVTNDHPLNWQAEIRYTPLGLGSEQDYFDVNEGSGVTVTKDGSYAFVAGRNFRALNDDIGNSPELRNGSNVGIIKDPLGENPQLIAATRPLPNRTTYDLVLSNDDKYLYVSNPHLSTSGDVLIFDVEEMIETLSSPEDYQIDSFERGVGSPFFNQNTARTVTSADFESVPIDDINPEISIAADYEIIDENRSANQFTFGVPEDSTRGPIVTGGNPRGIAITGGDWLDLKVVNLVESDGTPDLTPTLKWKFDGVAPKNIEEVNLFVSVFDEGNGLLPWDDVVDLSDASVLPELSISEKQDLLTRPWNGVDDFNPNRILTATWKQDTRKWYWHDGKTKISAPTSGQPNTRSRFTLPDELTLTAGQNYHWAVQALDNNGNVELEFGSFETRNPKHNIKKTFSSISVITHGFKPPTEGSGIPDSIYDLGNNIADSGGEGLVMQYNSDTGNWDAIDEQGRLLPDVEISDYYRQPLVLLTDWSGDNQSSIPDSGFTEGAADVIFTSLVELDQQLGGGGTVENIDGSVVNKQGAVFNSPLHFIGFSRGTVVNSEMIQRIGTHFPHAGGPLNSDGTPQLDSEGQEVRDLQMTTIDPHDFEQPGFSLPAWVPFVGEEGFGDFNEPEIQVWENITFADNYYQTVPKLDPSLLELTATPAGRLIENADLNVFLGTNSAEENYENSRAGFTRETDGIPGLAGFGATHRRVLSWYDGTTNLEMLKSPDELYRRLGDGYHEHLYNPDFPGVPNPWYIPDHQKTTFELGDENAPSEGIGTGWFYSVLGGGKYLRPESNLEERVPVSFENTGDRHDQGDFPVPTVFNGNFDAVSKPDSILAQALNTTNAIPGWSFHQDIESEPVATTATSNSESSTSSNPEVRGGNLVNVYEIPSLERHLELLGKEQPSSEESQSYAVELPSGESMTHNRLRIPDWGSLRFDLHVPEGFYTAEEVRQAKENNQQLPQKQLEVTIESSEDTITETFLLQQVDLGIKGQSLKDEQRNYQRDIFGNPDDHSHDARYKLDYATVGFETFQVDIPQNSGLHGEVANITFKLVDPSQTAKVYVDDVFFQSSHLRFGKPIPQEGNPNGSQVQEAFYSDANLENNPYQEALLLERPQYVLSYNGEKNIANWASWVLNQSWLYDEPENQQSLRFGEAKSRDLREDITLPKGFYQVSENDYQRFELDKRGDIKDQPSKGRLFEETINGKTTTSTYIMGHLVPRVDRNRNPGNYDPSHNAPRTKDAFLAVNLLSNIVPQHKGHNGKGFWQQIEGYTHNFAKEGNEVYVISGTYGSKGELTRDESLNWDEVPSRYNFNPEEVKPITIPQYLWRVMLVVDAPGADADENTYAVGFWTENRKYKAGEWKKQPVLTNVRDIENKTGYDFFANLPDEIENIIETQEAKIL